MNAVHPGSAAAGRLRLRLRLHATALACEHPVTGAWLSLVSPPPF